MHVAEVLIFAFSLAGGQTVNCSTERIVSVQIRDDACLH